MIRLPIVEHLEPEVRDLLAQVPEFAPRYMELVAASDGAPGVAAALAGLADFTAELARDIHKSLPLLRRALAFVEGLARRPTDGERSDGDAGGGAHGERVGEIDHQDLVAWAYLESLSPDDLRCMGPFFGPTTRSLLCDLIEGIDT